MTQVKWGNRMENKTIVDLWKPARERGEEVYLATVVHVAGSAYRKPGARMLVTEGGERAGTISGGCLEAEVSKKIAWLTSTGRVVEMYQSSFDDDNEGVPYGLGCGGTLWILMECGSPAKAVLNAMERALEADELSVVISNLDPDVKGSTIVVRVPDLEQMGLHVDPRLSGAVVEAAGYALSSRSIARVGTATANKLPATLCMPLVPPIHLHIFGAGDDAQPLCRMAAESGWHITVSDGRSHLLRSERFKEARELKLLSYTEPIPNGETLQRELLTEPETKAADFAVIMTHSYEQDRALLRSLLQRPLRYLGVLGPLHRTQRLVAVVAPQIGLPEDICLARLHAPVGMRIGSSDPASVAISILAEMHAESANESKRSSSDSLTRQLAFV